ncbi:Cell cycle regulated microtubule associated protein [Abeliophyllum distichum]
MNTKGASGHILHDGPKTKTKSANKLCQPRSSTLMRPTASHLAKQNKLEDTYSSCVSTRFQKSTIKIDEKITQSPPRVDNLATKRQKLEIGYLRKVAHLKHQLSLVHKLTKKVTVPKEPELETLLRAQRQRSKNSSESTEYEKPKASAFRARPSNRKAPLLPQPKKKTEFQEFHLKTMERAMQHASANVSNSNKDASGARSGGADSKRPNSRETLKPEKYGTSHNSKSHKVFPSIPDDDVVQDTKQDSRTLTESKIDSDNSLLQKPPTELFNKLSLRSDIESNKASHPKKHLSNKGLEENVPNSFRPEFWKCHAKPNQCGGLMREPVTGCWSNNRRLGIS